MIDDDHGWSYAPASTLHGALQRGCGRASTWVVARQTGSELVLDCVRRDYRWDRVVDERAVYLARLVRDLGLSVEQPRLGPDDVRIQSGTRPLCPSLFHRETPATTLLSLLADPDTPAGVLTTVLHEFGRHREPEPRLLDVAEELAARPDVLSSGLFLALDSLGPQTTRHARQWARSPTHPLWWRAVMVLTEHGDGSDVPVLLAAFDRLDSDEHDWCGYGPLAGGLARHGVTEIAPRLRSLWRQSPHTYERASYVKALLVLEPDRTRLRLPEALLDCESDVRLVAVHNAPLTGEVRERLSRLRDDPIEDDVVREAAAARLRSG